MQIKIKKQKNLIQLIIHGGFWLSALQVTNTFLTFAKKVILARLLAPHDFGLMGIALIAMMGMEQLSIIGIRPALIQNRRNTDEYLDSAWTVQVIRGIILFVIVFTIAPLVAAFFNNSEVTVIIRVMATIGLLTGFRNIGIVYFEKELEFNKEFVYQISGEIVGGITAVSLAIIFRNVWALVFGVLAADVVRCVMSYLVHPYKPKLNLDWVKVGKLLTFGKWVFGYTVIGFLSMKGADIFLGRTLGLSILGFYQMAFFIAMIPVTQFAPIISGVLFPTLSKLQEDIQNLRESFLTALEAVVFLALPISVGILLLGFDLTRLFFGEKWMPMVSALRIIAVAGFFHAITKIIAQLFKAIGRPNVLFWLELTRVGIMGSVMFPLIVAFGLNGAAIAFLLGSLVSIPIWWYKAAESIKVKSHTSLKRMSPSLGGVFIMSIFIIGVKQLFGYVTILEFLFLVFIGIISYFGFLLLLWKRFNCGPFFRLSIVKQYYKNGFFEYKNV